MGPTCREKVLDYKLQENEQAEGGGFSKTSNIFQLMIYILLVIA